MFARRLADRSQFHAGDFFTTPLPSGDVIVVGEDSAQLEP
jgi:hypothetical protein